MATIGNGTGIDTAQRPRHQQQQNKLSHLSEYRDTIMFHKPEDLHGELSNWYICYFRLDAETTYSSGEQMIMHQKALMFNDLRTAQSIMSTNNPTLQQQQGRMVRGFDEAVWAKHRAAVLLDCLRCKFTQNPSLAGKLMATHPRHLAEASTTDQVFGIGLKPTDARAWDPEQWRGDNLLGRTLERVRSELMRAEQQQRLPVQPRYAEQQCRQ